MEDPYFMVKKNIDQALAKAQAQLPAISRGTPDQVRKQVAQARGILSAAKTDLEDLTESVAIVERNPARFRLDAAQVKVRRDDVNRTREIVKELEIALTAALGQVDRQQRTDLVGGAANKVSVRNEVTRMIVEDEVQAQQMLMRDQEKQLDGVMNTVHTLKHMAITMGDEIEDQNKLLTEVDKEADTTGNKLKIAMGQLGHVMKASNDTKATWVIVCLTIVVIVLVIFVLV